MAKTILIVDDSDLDRTVLRGLLKGYNIVEAASGMAMLSVLRQRERTISAILLDLVMPDIDGFEALNKIRENAAYRQLPVIVVSGQNDEETQARALALGAVGFASKPYNRDILLPLLDNIINLRERSAFRNAFSVDALTGLLTRAAFYKQAAEWIKKHEPGYYMLTCFDIENFKVINDQYGLETGDKILKEIAKHISSAMVRLGGICCHDTADKFGMLYPAARVDSDEIKRLHELVISTEVIGTSFKIRVGRYLINDLTLPISAMYDRATIAEVSIKGRYDTYIAEYTEEMRQGLVYEQQVVNDMSRALAAGEFEPWFQPQFNHSTGAMIGAEALVRWRRDGKIIPPNEYIPVFERSGFIYEMDQHIWRSVCVLLRRWLDEGKNPLPVSVNISRCDLLQTDFMEKICALAEEYKLPPDLLRLEVTESAFSEATNAIYAVVNELINKGFTVEIDDFGSGYSSLNTLKDVPASILKLDMRFFENSGDAKRGGNIVESVVRMAKWLGMAVIAEGVEDKAQADYLKSIGCFYIQGYLYARPMPADEYEKLQDSGAKEAQLTRLQTIQDLDNNDFWDSRSMDTLIFNSYVGAACILELSKGKVEMLRTTEHFTRMLGGSHDIKAILDIDWAAHMDNRNLCLFTDTVLESLETKETVSGEFEFHGLPGCSETVILRCSLRVIATAGERYLIYCLNENMTAQRAAERAALNASERVNAVMDYSHCGISAAIPCADGTVEPIFVNNRFFELLGYTKEQYEAEIKSPYDCILPEDRAKVIDAVAKLTEIGSVVSLQMRNIRRDGSVIWLRVDISIVKFANVSEPVQLSSFLDITEQKENEMKQLESARQLEVIMSNVNGGVSAIQIFDDATSRFVFSNDKYYELYGYTKEEATAENLDIMTLMFPEDLSVVMENIRQLKKDHQPCIIDYRITRKDGRYAMLRANASLMSIPGYGDDVITSVVTDITEKKSLEETLSAIIANINGGISAVYLDKDKPEYVIANEQYYRLIGYTREEFEAKHINPFDLIHPDDREWVERKFAESQKYGEQYSMEYRIILRDGSQRYILCNTNVVHLFGVDSPVQLAVSNDITDIREMQRKELALSTQLQTIMKNIRGGITATLYHDENTIEMVFSNDGFYEMYGYTKAQLEAEVPNMLDLIFDEDREKTMETVERIVRERGSETYEYRCHKRDGGTVWVQCTNSVISLEGVGDTVLLAVTTDVTELRTAQQMQLAVTDRLRAVMNAMPNGMTAVTVKEHIRFLFANDQYYQIHGINPEGSAQNRLRSAFSAIHPDDRRRVHDIVTGTKTIGQSAETVYRIPLGDGMLRYVKMSVITTNLIGVDEPVQVAVYSDITAEREATDQLRFLNDTARDILAQSDSEQAIQNTLTNLINYFAADRGYIIELDEKRMVLSNTYEVCAGGVKPEIENWQELPYTTSDYWYESLSHNKFFTIGDVYAMDDSQSILRDMLLSQGIRSLILTPLWRDGHLFAFAGVDNPKHTSHHLVQINTLADYCTVLLTRRDMVRKITHDSEALQQFIDDTPGGFLRLQMLPDGTPAIVKFNAGFGELLGMTGDEVMSAYGADAHKCMVAEDEEMVKSAVAEALAGNGLYSYRCRLKRKNGTVIWAQVYGRFVRDENGELFRNSFFTDITEQKNKEQMQSDLLDNLPFGAAMYDFDGNSLAIAHINRQYWKLVGRQPTKYEKTSVTDAIHPEDRAATIQEIQSAIRQGRNAAVDVRILNGNGDYSPFHITASVVPQEEGKYKLFVAYAPISNEAISLQEMLPIAMSTMMETSSDISYIMGKDLHYISCSQAMIDIAGLTDKTDIIGKNAYDLFDRLFAEKFDEDDRHVIETGNPVINSLEHLPMVDGSISLARTSKYPIRDASGDVIGVYSTSHDVSAQRRRDSQLDLLTKSIPGGLASYSVSNEGIKTLYFNDGYFAFSGYTREEYAKVVENEPLALVFEEDRDRVRSMLSTFAAQRQDGMTGSCDYRCHTKDGQTRYMSLKASLALIDTDQYVLSVVQFDMTSHVEIEQRMVNLLDNLPFGAAMYEFDGKGMKALHINKQYQIMVGRDRNSENLEGYSPVDFIHPDDRAVTLNAMTDAIANHRDASCNIRILYGEDEYRSFHIDARIMAQPDGKYLVYAAYTRLSEQELTFENALPHMFSTIMEFSTDLAFAKDVNYRYICCSKTLANLLGLESEDDVVGKTDYELFPKEIADVFRRDDSALFATQRPQIDIEEIIPSPDGTKHYIRTSKHLLRSNTDAVIGIYCTGRDITEVQEAYARLRLLTDSIPGGIATFRCSPGKVEALYYNDGVCELVGYSREEYEAHPVPLLDLVFAEDRQIIGKQLEQLQSGEKHFSFTVRIHTKGCGYKWITGITTVIDSIGEVFSANTVLTDVTAQQEEKESLRLAEEEYRIATEHSARTICRYDVADMSMKVAHEAATRLGLSSVIQDVPYAQVKKGSVSSDTANNYTEFFERIILGEKVSEGVFCIKLNNRWRWLSARSTSIFDLDGKPVSAIISFTDITEAQEKELVYKKWKQSLTVKNPEQYTLFRCNLNKDSSYDTKEGALFSYAVDTTEHRQFNECTEEFCHQYVMEDDRSKYIEFLDSDRMLAGYHRGVRSGELIFRAKLGEGDIRWIRLSLELLEYPNSTDVEAYMMYEDINDSVQEELQIKKQAETDSLTGLQNRKIFIENVNGLIAQNGKDCYRALFLLDIDYFKHINDTFGHRVGDEAIVSMADVILSIIGTDGLVCRLGGDEFLVYLPDMPSRDAVADKARELCEATHITIKNDIQVSVSIGVALVTDEGENFDSMYHKSDKALYHVKGHGRNNFAFYEPDMERDDDEVMSDAVSTSLTSLADGKNTMLVVDDSAINRVVTAGMFKKDFSIVEAENGQVALDYLREHGDEVAIVLLDIMMPVMDGYGLLAVMKTDPVLREVPVIVISGEDDRKASLRAIQAGASDYVVKPADVDLLRLRVSSALSKSENERLRKQNSDYAVDSQELYSYRSLMDSNATVLMDFNAKTGIFKYAPKTGAYLNGTFDTRPLWQILAEDRIASDADVETIRKMIIESDKPCKATFDLMTPDGTAHPFLIKVIQRDASGNDAVVLITLTDRN